MSTESQQQALPLSVLFAGDVMLGRLINDLLEEKEPASLWGDTEPLFDDADVRLCNLECALCDPTTPRPTTPKAFRFRADICRVNALTVVQINAVSLANNHALDFGAQGLSQTLHVLDEAGIQRAGAGMTLREASAPAVWKVKGIRLGLLAFTDNEPGWAASEEQPGIWYTPIDLHSPRARQLFKAVERAREAVDLLIISAHWGPNWGQLPPAEHPAFAHALIDAGADLIFGHSGHILRGVEIYQHKPILYCTGDFLDDYAVDTQARNDRSGLFVAEWTRHTWARLFFYPTLVQSFQARRAPPHEKEAIIATMQHLCIPLRTSSHWNEQESRLEFDLT